MTDLQPVHILIVARDAAAADRWRRAVADEAVLVALDAAQLPGGPDVVLLDGEVAVPATGGADGGGMRAAMVVRVGGASAADVQLAADATDRELRLACALGGQLARLRRQLAQSSRQRQRLAAEAQTDPLTGLPNRRAWEAEVALRLEGRVGGHGDAGQGQLSAGATRHLCMGVIDLDHLKVVNDCLGHAAGDCLLRAVGGALRDALRSDDFVARLGGDEFGLLLWVHRARDAVAVVDRARQQVSQAGAAALGTADAPAHPVGAVTASAGLALAVELPQDMVATDRNLCPTERVVSAAEALFAAADAALRRAKQTGRNRTVLAD